MIKTKISFTLNELNQLSDGMTECYDPVIRSICDKIDRGINRIHVKMDKVEGDK